MSQTLNAWIQDSPGVPELEQNLRTNLEAMTELTKEEIDDLMRLNMIMVRQYIEETYE
jgi:hypothetical protein